jgi:HPt (histidine-containing phosphotransfer) domain-containing protein
MDAFITKPIDDTQLHYHLSRAIERQLRRGIALEPMPAPGTPSTADLDAMFGVFSGPPPVNEGADQNAGQNEGRKEGRRAGDLKGRLRSAFVADLPRRRAELDAALTAGDHEAAGRLLHGMRGSAGYLGDSALYGLCGELEREADHGNLDAVRAALPRLLRLLDGIETELA